MSTRPRLLSADEVIRFKTQGVDTEDQNSANLVQSYRSGNDIAYVKQLMREITSSSSASHIAKYLADGCAVEVVLLDQKGWHRGKLKLELIFYPEEPQPQPAPSRNETLDLLSS